MGWENSDMINKQKDWQTVTILNDAKDKITGWSTKICAYVFVE